MLNITSINHVGIRIADKNRSLSFYQQLGFELSQDAGFAQGHPIIMQHPCGIVLNLLGPADAENTANILMDIPEKHPGYTHIALNVTSLAEARSFMQEHNIAITGSFSFGPMSAIFIRDPDRNVIELDAYNEPQQETANSDSQHP
ncbi:MAG: VOC family protein [Mariprofundaceae bacterium]|nr:VOC family protein [Mariprofundaceae bacterium]